MKAVLEYTYPQDELKLKHALKGEDYYLALVEINRVFAYPHLHVDKAGMLDQIKYLLEEVLEE
jgi:hypothetical protein